MDRRGLARSETRLAAEPQIFDGERRDLRQAFFASRTGLKPARQPMVDYVLCALLAVSARQDIVRLVGLAAQILESVSGESHTVDQPRTIVLKHEVLRYADQREA